MSRALTLHRYSEMMSSIKPFSMQTPSFPGFELIAQLGQGGMATVWKARQLSLDRLVAIKILSPSLSQDPADVERFQAECKSAAHLKHPGIVQVYDAFVHNGHYCLVMEYVAGESVGQRIRRKKRLTEDECLFILDHVARALDYAWKTARLIHCDIKPDNILIDTDGSVKVADLGLATTLGAMSRMACTDEVLGTPHFMSPEQIRGGQPLDCRSDIYSMGATLYQMATGRLLFEGLPDDQVLEKQLNGLVPDVLDVTSGISLRFSWMVEKMLAKDPAHRHPNWEAVVADTERLMQKLAPQPPFPPVGSSTMARSRRRQKLPARPSSTASNGYPPAKTHGGDAIIRIVVLLLIAAALMAIGFLAYRELTEPSQPLAPPRPDSATKAQPPPPAPSPVTEENRQIKEKQAGEMFEFALRWARENPDRFDEAIVRFQKVAEETKGTPYSLMAMEEINRLRQERNAQIQRILAALRLEAEELAGQGLLSEAAQIFENYTNRLATETRQARHAEAARYREMAARERARLERELRQARQILDLAFQEAAHALVRNRPAQALERLLDAERAPESAPLRKRLQEPCSWIRTAAFPDLRIAESFAAQAGQEVTLQLVSGPRTVTIQEVREGVLLALQKITTLDGAASASVQIRIPLSELAPAERLQRMGPETDPAAALFRGALAAESRDWPRARTLFQNVPNELGAALLSALNRLQESSEGAPPPAVQDSSSQTPKPFAPRDFVPAERFKILVLEANPALSQEDVQIESDAEGRVLKAKIASPALKNLDPLTRVSNTLTELLIPQCQASQWTPIASLTLLERLDLSGSAISDLAPLRALSRLSLLNLNNTRVRDLSPLRTLPLRELELAETKAFAFDPLRSLRLNRLNLSNTSFNDLSLLREMPLQDLDLSGCKVFDFTPLRRFQLLSLSVADTGFRDPACLTEMSLQHLNLANSKISDLSAMRRLPLLSLDISRTTIRDLTPLREVSTLRRLRFDQCRIKDLSPLTGLSLEALACNDTLVDDLSPLKGMRLAEVEAARTPLTSITVLAGMPLQRVLLSQTRVSDLEPLRNSPIRELHVQGFPPQALFPLRGLPVEILYADPPRGFFAGFEIWRLFPNLKEFNGQPLPRQAPNLERRLDR